MRLWSARPKNYNPSMPVVFAFHGAARNASDYRDHWLPVIDSAGALVIAPEYPADSFPGLRWFNFGNLQDDDGKLLPRAESTYGIVPRIFEKLRASRMTTAKTYALFGHSAGGQYVHRAVSAGFTEHVSLAITANSGTYAMPDLDIGFPYGLGGLGLTEQSLSQLLAFPLTVMAGTLDIDPTDPTFPKEPAAMVQGGTRLERAHRYFEAGKHAAERRKVPFGWTASDVVDVAHDGLRITAAVAPLIAKHFNAR